ISSCLLRIWVSVRSRLPHAVLSSAGIVIGNGSSLRSEARTKSEGRAGQFLVTAARVRQNGFDIAVAAVGGSYSPPRCQRPAWHGGELIRLLAGFRGREPRLSHGLPSRTQLPPSVRHERPFERGRIADRK